MSATPRKNASKALPRTPTTSGKGLFIDGVWNCNCVPRLPATHFYVKKDGPNKGRGFYTCQKSIESGCGFFLWEEQASGREAQALLSNSRSEPKSQGVSKRLDTEDRFRRAIDSQSTVGTDSDSEEYGEWPLTQTDIKTMTSSARTNSNAIQPQTPRKAAKMDYTSMPGSKRKRDEIESLPTPSTMKRAEVFTTSSTSRLDRSTQKYDEGLGIGSTSITPTPSRFRNVSIDPSHRGGEDYEVTEEVLNLLETESISHNTLFAVRQTLNKFGLRASGVSKGREITRLALKSKDSQIAELQQRIATLEGEREMDKALIKRMKGDIRSYITEG